MTALMEAAQLADVLAAHDCRIFDMRGEKAYSQGHVAGAVNVPRATLFSTAYPYACMRLDSDALQRMLRALGVNKDQTLVLYDDRANYDSCRFWWLLAVYGFRNVMIIDGGIDALLEASVSLVSEPPSYAEGDFAFDASVSRQDWLSDHVELQSVVSEKRDTASVLLDVRLPAEFNGQECVAGASYAGRLPNAKWLDFHDTVDKQNANRFKSKAALLALCEQVGLNPSQTIHCYCHAGIRSAHTLFALTQILGFPHVTNYDGSWIEWSYLGLPYESEGLPQDEVADV
ncbi:sulfurtransferase [Thaumasiovibrio subtropicus]|uniref:sulfurtransferase n=1 Tax=Thaumasiovibrio subtropicus TaxID=1891207 RepID=UPI000B35F1ED|nr:rhodanese-like domain-containing protein [Thaumasiovibrio subtropicus]